MVDKAKALRLLRMHERRRRALTIIINEIRRLEEKYVSDPDVVDMLLRIESMLNKMMEKIIHGINVQRKKLEEIEKKP